MTLRRVFFRAEERNPVAFDPLPQPGDTGLKPCRFGDLVVENTTVVII
jgi:hypothetical protein